MFFRIFSYFFALLIALVISTAIVVAYGYHNFVSNGPLRESTTVLIKKGTSLSSIADSLEQKEIISNSTNFKIFARVMGLASSIKVGEYEFAPKMSGLDVLQKISSGNVVMHKFSVAEGTTSAEIVKMLNEIEILSGEIDREIVEGTLLPETYYYTYGDDRNSIIRRMQKALKARLDELWQNRTLNLPIKSKEEAVILASIVEKETGVAHERDVVASVFSNRLRKNMRLQSDPTVIYAFQLDRKLYTKDLQKDHPYNTYKNYGLTPGPICNPGLDAIKAVLNPAETSYLYFVADGTGGHVFATNLDDHNRNVRKWREINK